jgi:aromatic ring-opening dioxygenase catalytic subunit (LigB family)
LNDGNEISLVPGLERLRREVLDELRPDAFVVFDTHWATTVEFVVTSHARRNGLYTSDELPRGIRQLPYDLAGAPALANGIASSVSERGGVRCTAIDDPCLPIHYPTVNLAHYLDRGERWVSVSICQTARDDDFLAVGAALGQAVGESGERVVLLASGGMSHRFWPLAELERHEASDLIHVRTPGARAADEQRLAWWSDGDHASVIDAMDAYRAHKPEGMFGHYLMMVSALGGRDCVAAGRQFSDYENAAGTGQVHVWFDRPAQGWVRAA